MNSQATRSLRGGGRALLIVGPRQVGKTVLLRQLADELLARGWPSANLSYFDFSDDRLIEEISAREIVAVTPAGLSSERPRIFLLDEISKATEWDTWLKQVVDKGRDQFIVTDSAASLLRQGTIALGVQSRNWAAYFTWSLESYDYTSYHLMDDFGTQSETLV